MTGPLPPVAFGHERTGYTSHTSHTPEVYPERDPRTTNLCSMRLVWLLSDLGVPRRRALLLSEQEATCLLAVTLRDRLIDQAVRKAAGHD